MYKFITNQIKFSSEDGHIRHQEIQKHFPYGSDVRFRAYPDKVIICSSNLPVTGISCDMVVLQPYNIGDQLKFNILANATYTVNDNILPVLGIKNLVGWFQDQASKHGFDIKAWEKIISLGFVKATKEDQIRTHNSVEFQGKLKVMDANKFNKTIGSIKSDHYGIGRAKYCGFGILEVDNVS